MPTSQEAPVIIIVNAQQAHHLGLPFHVHPQKFQVRPAIGEEVVKTQVHTAPIHLLGHANVQVAQVIPLLVALVIIMTNVLLQEKVILLAL